MQRIDSVIPDVLKQAASTVSPVHRIQECWQAWVGEGLATHTQPKTLRGAKLIIAFKHPADAYVLSYKRPELLRLLKHELQLDIQELVFQASS